MKKLLDLKTCFENAFASEMPSKIIISKPSKKTNEFKKIVIEQKQKGYQISQYTEKQVFHRNIPMDALVESMVELIGSDFRQVNAFVEDTEHMILISKDGSFSYKKKTGALSSAVKHTGEHNRKKNYLINNII